MATAGIDRSLKIWDLRTYKALYSYKVSAGPGSLAFSQRGLLAAGMGNVVEVYQGIVDRQITAPYMMHKLNAPVANLQFCPYEDVLGVGYGKGFSSLLIPGMLVSFILIF
jgi:U3 small nucleolar RNA-associated protein 7